MPEQRHEDRADQVARRLALPVLVAALASVPAVFLTLFDDPWARVGIGLNLASGVVLVAETVVLFVIAEDRRRWLRRNRFLVGLTLLLIPAVVLAVGPVQLLRLVRVAGALRIVRVGRILRAGRVLRDRASLERGWQRGIGLGVTLLCAAFVAAVLADPTSTSRQLVEQALGWGGPAVVVVAGLALAAATFVVVQGRAPRLRTPRRDADGPPGPEASPEQSPQAEASGGTRSFR